MSQPRTVEANQPTTGSGAETLRAVEVLLAGGFAVCDEVREQLLLAFKFEAERAPQRQVLLDVSAKDAHLAPPGHGAASLRSVSMSTRRWPW